MPAAPVRAAAVQLLACDTETCALGRGRDRIVQFSFVALDAGLREEWRWTELVDPQRRIPPFATSIHGITDAMVRGKPSFHEFAPDVQALLDARPTFMAYNARFDAGVLHSELLRCGEPGWPEDLRVVDPLLIERRVNGRSLGDTYRRYTGRELVDAHDAEADCLAMVEVLRRQLEVHAGRLPPLAELATTADPPDEPESRSHFTVDRQGVVRFAFGAHRGEPARDKPGYLQWMLKQDFPEESKQVARTLLAVRPVAGLASAAPA